MSHLRILKPGKTQNMCWPEQMPKEKCVADLSFLCTRKSNYSLGKSINRCELQLVLRVFYPSMMTGECINY